MGTIWSRTEAPVGNTDQECPDASQDESIEIRKKEMEEDMRKFKAELAAKREVRKEAIAALNRKIAELKGDVEKERKERERLESLLEGGRGSRGEVEGLESLLEGGGGSRGEVEGLEKQVQALKDVAAIGGEMLRIRELQVNELKEKIQAIEETGVAYEKEVENMRRLKGLYEERSRAMAISNQMEIEREKARVLAAETRLEIAEEKNRELLEAKNELEERVSSLDASVDKNNNDISELRVQLAGKKEELYNVTSQMTIINNLFSQVLSDPENLDRVNRVLEEHHNLVNHLTEKGKITDVASVLMTVADKDRVLTQEEQDVATNLSKVWRLLVELLGHHNKHTSEGTIPDSCYKSVDTPSGPKLVISVSKTFLRLKDLILEKNSLVKEVGRLKDLNCHLEKRLISQETRLAEVAEELHKTWGVVNKLKTQHKALHTHEQVLRYELKHKRLMLNELKQQLEDCREMWQMARVKNNQTEKDWIQLRQEFADRKQQISNAESGYEESPGDSQDEEDSHKLSDEETDSPEETVSDPIDDPPASGCTSDRPNTPENFNLQCSAVNKNIVSSESSEKQSQNNSVPEEISSSTSPEHEALAQQQIITSVPGSASVRSNGTEVENENTRLTPVFPDVGDEEIQEMQTSIRLLPWEEGEVSTDYAENEDKIQVPQSETDSKPAPEVSEETTVIKEGNETSRVENFDEIEEPRPESATASKPHERSDSVATCSATELNEVVPKQEQKKTTAEEILERREARLRRLEEQCKGLFSKMNNTNIRSEQISNKLVELHEHYGEGRSEVQDQLERIGSIADSAGANIRRTDEGLETTAGTDSEGFSQSINNVETTPSTVSEEVSQAITNVEALPSTDSEEFSQAITNVETTSSTDSEEVSQAITNVETTSSTDSKEVSQAITNVETTSSTDSEEFSQG